MPSLVMLPFIQCHHTRGRAPAGGFSNPLLSGSGLFCAVAMLAPSKSTMIAMNAYISFLASWLAS